jgi:hypothetical protein
MGVAQKAFFLCGCKAQTITDLDGSVKISRNLKTSLFISSKV